MSGKLWIRQPITCRYSSVASIRTLGDSGSGVILSVFCIGRGRIDTLNPARSIIFLAARSSTYWMTWGFRYLLYVSNAFKDIALEISAIFSHVQKMTFFLSFWLNMAECCLTLTG